MAKKNNELELLSSEYCHVPNQGRLLSQPFFMLCAVMQLKTCKKPEGNLNMRDATMIVQLAWHWPKGLWRKPVQQVQLPQVFIILRNLTFLSHVLLGSRLLGCHAMLTQRDVSSRHFEWRVVWQTKRRKLLLIKVGYYWKPKHSLSLALAGGILQNYETEEVSLLLTAILVPFFLLALLGPQGWNPRGSPAQPDNNWCKLKACCPRKDQNLEESTAVWKK